MILCSASSLSSSSLLSFSLLSDDRGFSLRNWGEVQMCYFRICLHTQMWKCVCVLTSSTWWSSSAHSRIKIRLSSRLRSERLSDLWGSLPLGPSSGSSPLCATTTTTTTNVTGDVTASSGVSVSKLLCYRDDTPDKWPSRHSARRSKVIVSRSNAYPLRVVGGSGSPDLVRHKQSTKRKKRGTFVILYLQPWTFNRLEMINQGPVMSFDLPDRIITGLPRYSLKPFHVWSLPSKVTDFKSIRKPLVQKAAVLTKTSKDFPKAQDSGIVLQVSLKFFYKAASETLFSVPGRSHRSSTSFP